MPGTFLATRYPPLAALLLLLTAAPAFGHKLNVTVTPVADPPRLRVEASYDDGTPADGATVTVRDAAGVEVGRTALDGQGVGELPWPAGGWTVAVDDGAGHRASVSGMDDQPATTAGPNRWRMAAAGAVVIGGWAVWRRRSRR